jgi:hypothetical protein
LAATLPAAVGGFLWLLLLPSVHAVVITPVEPQGRWLLSRFPRPRPSPCISRVGFHITIFEACSTFTRVTACTFAEPLNTALCIEGFDEFVTSFFASIATG